MLIYYFVITAYLIATWLLLDYIRNNKSQQLRRITMLIICTVIAQIFYLNDFINAQGIVFGLANSIAFTVCLISLLLLIFCVYREVHVLGIFIYPLSIIALAFTIISPDNNNHVVKLDIASHILLSMSAYSMLAIVACQAILIKAQQKQLHAKKINAFIQKLPALQTMEKLMFNSLVVGFLLLTASLITGFIFIDDFFAQHLMHKTVLSISAWVIFAVLIIGRQLFGWRGTQTISSIQIAFVVLLIGYFGSKFVLERLLS